MSFENALKYALSVNSRVDSVTEYKDAWVFFGADWKGQDAEVVVYKSGETTSFSHYIMTSDHYDPNIESRRIDNET